MYHEIRCKFSSFIPVEGFISTAIFEPSVNSKYTSNLSPDNWICTADS